MFVLTVNIHLIFYRLLQQTILILAVHNSKLQWIDYPFVNDYSKENITCYLVALILYSLRILILNSFFSTRFILHISNKNSRQYLIHFNTYSKKLAPIFLGLTGCVLILLISYRQFDLRFLSIIFQLLP